MGSAPTFEPIRRKDREVASLSEIAEILNRCPVVRVAFRGEKYPYIVPLSFGTEMTDGRLSVYFHCAPEGRKTECVRRDPHVCVEADRFFGTEQTAHGITARYESFIGFGICEFLQSKEDKIRGLRTLTKRYGYSDYPIENCADTAHSLIGKITFEHISGKRNASASAHAEPEKS